MIRRSTLIAFEILVGIMVTIGFGLGFLAWRLSQGPVVLPGMKQHIEQQLAEARGGASGHDRTDRARLVRSRART